MQQLSLAPVVRERSWILLPIEETRIEASGSTRFGYARVSKTLHALIIARDEHRRAVAADGKELSLDSLISRIPEIAEILEP